MRVFNSVVQALMSTMIGIWRDSLYRFNIAAKLLRHDDTGLTELPDQPREEEFGGFCVTTRLNQDVENITVRINCTPEPEFPAGDRDDDLVYMPLVIRPWPLFANAMSKIATRAVDPKANRFPAYDHASLCKKIFHIGRAQRNPVIDPYCISDNLTRKAKPLQPGKRTG